jgi:hypothetical protein
MPSGYRRAAYRERSVTVRDTVVDLPPITVVTVARALTLVAWATALRPTADSLTDTRRRLPRLASNLAWPSGRQPRAQRDVRAMAFVFFDVAVVAAARSTIVPWQPLTAVAGQLTVIGARPPATRTVAAPTSVAAGGAFAVPPSVGAFSGLLKTDGDAPPGEGDFAAGVPPGTAGPAAVATTTSGPRTVPVALVATMRRCSPHPGSDR